MIQWEQQIELTVFYLMKTWEISLVRSSLERHKRIYERHENGEKFTVIARELGMSVTNARKLAMRWARELAKIEYEKNRVYTVFPKLNNHIQKH